MLGVVSGFFCLLVLFVFDIDLCWLLFSCLVITLVCLLSQVKGHILSVFFYVDGISYPLLVLSCFMMFLSLLSGLNLKMEGLAMTGYLMCVVCVGLVLCFCFMVNVFLGFFIFFELSMMPLVVLITRWGSQKARVQASVYFIFFTLTGSFPLLLYFFFFFFFKDSSMMGVVELVPTFEHKVGFGFVGVVGGMFTVSGYWFWWLGVLGLLVKMPMYGLHLWLPKAHVEAPMSGSMLLAALLLKLGGYGLIRMGAGVMCNWDGFVVPFCFLGVMVSSVICLRQTDLKSLIAYSSVGHMSLVSGGILLKTTWSMSGALILMIAHGLVSSCLFCLANLIYERSSTRALKLTRGLWSFSFLFCLFWMSSCVANLGLPPFPNFLGELLMLLASFDVSFFYVLVLGFSLVISSGYSLLIFQKCCSGELPRFLMLMRGLSKAEHLLMIMHLVPLLMILLNPELCFCW